LGKLTYERARWVCEAADKRKALDIAALDVGRLTVLCDYFVICHGRSLTHVESVAEGIEEYLEERGVLPQRRVFPPDAKWVVLDYGDVVAHVFTAEARAYYNLEGLWAQADSLDLSDIVAEAEPVEEQVG